MGIDAAQSERTDTGDSVATVLTGPRPILRNHLDWKRRPGNTWIWLLEMDLPYQGFPVQAQHQLYQAGDPGRLFQVADIGLDRTDE